MSVSILGLVAAISFLGAVWKFASYGMRPKKYPPGPPTLPLVGNLHQLAFGDLHLQFQRWARKYGSIVSLKLGGQDFILLNDADAVKHLIEKRGRFHSGRPHIFLREYSDDLDMILRDNDGVWRRHRKMYNVHFNMKSANRYVPYQLLESTQLMNDLLENPTEFESHLHRYTTSVASTMFYGWRTTSAKIGYAEELIQWVTATAANASPQLIDIYPFLRPIYRLLPTRFSKYKQNLRKIRQVENTMFYSLMDDAKLRIEEGKVHPSFIRDMLLCQDEDKLDDKEIAHSAAHGFAAATDTQLNTLLGFIKAMILFPKVQEEAQREIDTVVGAERLPNWEDRERLPYIRGVVEETLRWMPTLTIAVPHRATATDEYKGFTIPKDASMIINVWTLNNAMEDPRNFDPTRYSAEFTAVENNAINPDSTKRVHYTFGAGRRVCAGFHAAERGLFIAISRMLWGFKFSKILDETGRPLPIERDAVTHGILVRPIQYLCDIATRDNERAETIRNSWKITRCHLGADENFTREFFGEFN